MISCLILEDEKAAQEILIDFIEKTPFMKCLGVYESGIDIPQKLLSETDVLFLDMELPELNGLSYLKSIDKPPKVVITTAYIDYAVEAFEENVLDYLVKPFSYERFFKAVTRAKDRLLKDNKKIEKHFFIYADKVHHRIPVENILYIKAEVDYVKIFTKDSTLLVLDSLRNWEEKLYNFNFIRTHRSYIINKDKIEKISGNQIYISNIPIPIGKTFKDDFLSSIHFK